MKKIYFVGLLALLCPYLSFSQNNLRIITPVTATPASNNTLVGVGAGNTTMTGANNTMFGRSTGPVNTTGYSNVFVGAQTGLLNTTGYENIIIGSVTTGAKINTGGRNVAIGVAAGANITNPINNTMIGYSAGSATTTGGANTFLGWSAGSGVTTGQRNVHIGATAGLATSTASYNVFIGNEAGYGNTTGEINVFIGNQSGKANTTGTFNTFLGNESGLFNTTARFNAFFGNTAGRANTTGENNSFFGNFAGTKNTSGTFNTFLGNFAGSENTTASENTFIGSGSGMANTIGFHNAFLGLNSGRFNTTGSQNTFIGRYAGFNNTTASVNTFVGNLSGQANTTGTFNTFLGQNSGQGNTTGGFNTFLGNAAGFGNTTASYNTFVGQASGQAITTGQNNTLLGANAGLNITTSPNNVIIGVNAGQSALTTGGSNTFIGYQADGTGASAATLFNATAIGFNAKVGQNNAIVLGDNTINVGIGTSTPQNRLEIVSSAINTSGLRLKNLTSTSPTVAANGKVLSVATNGDVILVPGSSAPSDSITLSRLNFGNTNFRIDNSADPVYSSFLRFGDNTGKKLLIGRLKESAAGALNTGATGQLISITDNGKMGLGTDSPQNNLEIVSPTANASGLRFNKLKSTSTAGLTNGKVLTVDANGDVVLVNDNTVPKDSATFTQLNFGVTNLRIENSTNPAYSSFLRFGDNTGKKLLIGRLKESAAGAINTGVTGQLVSITDNGKMGIGTDSPQNNLEIVSSAANLSGLRITNLKTTTPTASNGKTLSIDANGDVILVTATSSSASTSDLTLDGTNSWALQTPDGPSETDLIITPKIGAAFSTTAQTTFKNNGNVYFTGNIGIGTTDTKGYKFAVAGNMVTEKVFVKKQANWPDFVFEKNYELPSLQSVEAFIKENKHLPNIPSAKEVEANGHDLGDMNAKLLQKLEEMTLYIIDLKKEVDGLKKQINTSQPKN